LDTDFTDFTDSKEFQNDCTAKSNFTTEGTETTEIRRRRIAEHFLLNSLFSLLLNSVISVSSVVAFLLFAVQSFWKSFKSLNLWISFLLFATFAPLR
jgi:hypothetical protein